MSVELSKTTDGLQVWERELLLAVASGQVQEVAADTSGLSGDVANPKHVNYPHEPGRLADCLACEAECFCNPGIGWTPNLPVSPCVYCAEQMDAFGG